MKFPIYSTDGKNTFLGNIVIKDVQGYTTMNEISFVDVNDVSRFINILPTRLLNSACDQLKLGIQIGYSINSEK